MNFVIDELFVLATATEDQSAIDDGFSISDVVANKSEITIFQSRRNAEHL